MLQGPAQFKYLSYDEMTRYLRDVSAQHPDITRLYSIGKSTEQREMWVLEISDQPGVHEPGEIV